MDYKVEFKPRYGHGLPPHSELYNIINNNNEIIQNFNFSEILKYESPEWIESVSMQQKITAEEIQNKIDEFELFLKTIEKIEEKRELNEKDLDVIVEAAKKNIEVKDVVDSLLTLENMMQVKIDTSSNVEKSTIKNITSFLDINVNYQGRKSETGPTIHTGNIQLRAYF